MQRLPRRVTHVVVIALAALPLAAGCSSSSGDKRADTLCEQLSENHTTAPDQIARRIYGDGQFATAAQGIRSACVEDHGAVAVYLDETANFTSDKPVPQVPPGYGTSTY